MHVQVTRDGFHLADWVQGLLTLFLRLAWFLAVGLVWARREYAFLMLAARSRAARCSSVSSVELQPLAEPVVSSLSIYEEKDR